MAAFRHAAFAIEHVAFAGLAPWAVCLLLPFAYPAVCAAHANLLFVNSFHPLNWHNTVYIDPHSTLHAGLRAEVGVTIHSTRAASIESFMCSPYASPKSSDAVC